MEHPRFKPDRPGSSNPWPQNLELIDVDKTCEQMPGKRSNKEYETQGWNAALLGHAEAACPYYETSTASRYWLKGFRSVN